MYRHKGKGRIVYDPYRGDMKKKTTNWCVLEVDKEISRYYRWWVKKEKWIDLNLPSFDCHCSIIRGEAVKPSLVHLWKKYQGEILEFEYEHNVRQTLDTKEEGYGAFWFVDVYCPEINHIRDELGLKTFHHFHITIGRLYF